MNYIVETFNDISELLRVLNSRENNSVMKYEDSSETGSCDFTGTKSLEEAEELLRYGWFEKVNEVKKMLRVTMQESNKLVGKRAKILNSPVGYIPNVPNAIQNKPDSMIRVLKEPSKQKTVHVMYSITANAGHEAEFFIKMGVRLVTALNIIEQSGIRTKLSVIFFGGRKNDDRAVAALKIKDYGEPFNLGKICFPLIHPSMFRRVGFRWLEKAEGLQDSDWTWGYGRPMDTEDFEQLMEIEGFKSAFPDAKIVNIKQVEGLGNVESVLRYIVKGEK